MHRTHRALARRFHEQDPFVIGALWGAFGGPSSPGKTSDFRLAQQSLKPPLDAREVIVGKGYVTQGLASLLCQRGAGPVIPPGKCSRNRRIRRHEIQVSQCWGENFCCLKDFRRITTCYANSSGNPSPLPALVRQSSNRQTDCRTKLIRYN